MPFESNIELKHYLGLYRRVSVKGFTKSGKYNNFPATGIVSGLLCFEPSTPVVMIVHSFGRRLVRLVLSDQAQACVRRLSHRSNPQRRV